jgi:hypothetical protein
MSPNTKAGLMPFSERYRWFMRPVHLLTPLLHP